MAPVTEKEIEKAGDWILNVQCVRGRSWNPSEEGIDLFQQLKFPSLDLKIFTSLGCWKVNLKSESGWRRRVCFLRCLLQVLVPPNAV